MTDDDPQAGRPHRHRPAPRPLNAVPEEPTQPPDSTEGAVWDARTILWPGSDYQDGTLYITFPIAREEEVIVGRGKDKHTVIERNMRTMCVTSEGSTFWYDKDTVMRRGYAFPPTFTQELESRWELDDIRRFTAGDVPDIDPKALWQHIRDRLFEYVEYTDDHWYDVVSYYILTTYVFRTFSAIGYLHFNGTMASGKSQNLRILSLLAFNAIWASNMSAASLYRQVAGCPGMICIDEVEDFDGERGEDIRRLLNAGYTSPGWVPRSEKQGDGWATVKFSTFAPKALASINPLEPVIGQRCLVVPMQPALRRIKSLALDDPMWADTRNQLYRWAMQSAEEIGELHTTWQNDTKYTIDTDLKDRQWEIALPMVVMAEHVGGLEAAMFLVKFFEKVFEEQRQAAQDEDWQRTLLQVLPRAMDAKTSDDGLHWRIKDIRDTVAEYIEQDMTTQTKYTVRLCSKHLSSLGWRGRKQHKGGTMVPITEDEVRDQFTKHRMTPMPEDVMWFARKMSYVHRSSSPDNAKPDQRQGFNWQEADAAATDDGGDAGQ